MARTYEFARDGLFLAPINYWENGQSGQYQEVDPYLVGVYKCEAEAVAKTNWVGQPRVYVSVGGRPDSKRHVCCHSQRTVGDRVLSRKDTLYSG